MSGQNENLHNGYMMKNKTQVYRLYKLVVAQLPKRYQYDVKICNSGQAIFREIKKRDGIKESIQKIKEDREYECLVLQSQYENQCGKHTKLFEERFPAIKDRRGVIFFAFSGEPILLNGYILQRESPEFVAAVILHEIGHNEGYITEDGADKFALRWMDKIWEDVKKQYE